MHNGQHVPDRAIPENFRVLLNQRTACTFLIVCPVNRGNSRIWNQRAEKERKAVFLGCIMVLHTDAVCILCMIKYRKRGVVRTMNTAKEFAVAICDDALQDAETLEHYIKQILSGSRIFKYTKGEQLVKDMEKQAHLYNVVFLAICMKEKNGIEVAKAIRKSNRTIPIVFTSVSDQFYREAFDIYAFQYLLKPVTYTQIKEVLDQLGMVKEPAVVFRYRSRVYTIKHNEIRYISSSLHTVNFHLKNGREFHCRGKLADFGAQLQNSQIIRCHQSFYVNLDSIIGMKSNNFILDDIVIPISRTYMKEVQVRYLQHLKK